MTTTTKRPDGGKLKPCPFCGDRAWFSGFVVQCKSCGASLIKQERGAAIEAWNTRTPSNESHAPQADETANDIADALERSTQSMARECKVGMGLWNGHSNVCLNAIALLRKAAVPAPQAGEGIYIASKTVHASRWRILRDKVGEPIISTWIDEAGAGESKDLHDLWHRCLTEAAACRVLIAYREKDEVFKGGWVEIGAALSSGVPVYAVGLEEFTIAKYRGITHFPDMKSAIAESRKLLRSPVPAPQPPVEGLREDVKRWKLVDGKVTTGESVIFDGTFIVAKVTRREDAELILAALASPSLTAGVSSELRRAWLDKLNAIAPAVENLAGHQEQCDFDGVMVKVSRQALDEVLNAVNDLAVSFVTAPATLIEQSGQKDFEP